MLGGRRTYDCLMTIPHTPLTTAIVVVIFVGFACLFSWWAIQVYRLWQAERRLQDSADVDEAGAQEEGNRAGD